MGIMLKILLLILLNFMMEKKVLDGIAIEVEMTVITILYYVQKKNH